MVGIELVTGTGELQTSRPVAWSVHSYTQTVERASENSGSLSRSCSAAKALSALSPCLPEDIQTRQDSPHLICIPRLRRGVQFHAKWRAAKVVAASFPPFDDNTQFRLSSCLLKDATASDTEEGIVIAPSLPIR